MPRSRLLSLLALLVVVVGIALVLEFLGPVVRPEASLLGIRADDVVGIRVMENARELRATRLGETWHVQTPSVTRPAAPAAVAEMVHALSALVPVDTFQREEIDMRALGIDPPRARIELDIRGRAGQVVLLLGDYVPTGGSVYGVLASDPRIHKIGAAVVSEIEEAFYRTLPAEEPAGASTR